MWHRDSNMYAAYQKVADDDEGLRQASQAGMPVLSPRQAGLLLVTRWDEQVAAKASGAGA